MSVTTDKLLKRPLLHNHTASDITGLDTTYVNVTGDTMTGALNITGSADVPQLLIKAHSSQTDYISEWQNSAGTTLFGILSGGAPISLVSSTVTSGTGYGARFVNTATPATASTANYYGGWPSIDFEGVGGTTGVVASSIYSTNINTAVAVTNVSGAWCNVGVPTGVAATLTNVYGYTVNAFSLQEAVVTLAAGVRSRMASIDTGSITNSYGFFLVAATIGAGSITNQYGVYIPTITGASTLNYAMYTNLGAVRFGDDTSIEKSTGGLLTLKRVDTTITANDVIGTLQWYAADASTTTTFVNAKIEVQATNTVTTDINPTRMIFSTTGTGVAGALAESFRISASQRISIGTSADATAVLHLKAGTATASTAPLKFTSGTNLTAAEAGAVEFTTDDLFFTITTGAARKAFILDDGTRLTAGRIPFATTNGRLVDDADFTFATDTLTVTKIAATTFTGNPTISKAVPELDFTDTVGSKTWRFFTQNDGTDLQIRSPNGADVWRLNNDSDANYFINLNTQSKYSGAVAMTVKGSSGQTANLTEWQNDSSTVLAYISPTGAFTPASMADGSAPNSSLYYSTTASKLVYKDSGGTVNALY